MKENLVEGDFLALKSQNELLQDRPVLRRESGLSRVLGSMTKLLSKNLMRSTDLLFLKSLTGSTSIIKKKDLFLETDAPPAFFPVTHDSIRLIEQAKTICEQRIYLDEAKELFSLISSKWMQAVLEIHDEVAAQIQNCHEDFEYIDGVSSICEEDLEEILRDDEKREKIAALLEEHGGNDIVNLRCYKDDEELEEIKVDTFRVIGVRKKRGECLGLTVRLEHGKLTVARILIDSVIDRQGLVQTGDTILQCNGKDVKTPEELQKAIDDTNATDFIVFKVRPAVGDDPDPEEVASTVKPETQGKGKFFVRALFNYNPSDDNLLPCQDIGLPFVNGDVLEVVNWSDPSWWQARKVNSKERPGLVPSQDLEERRQCFVQSTSEGAQIAGSGRTMCCGAGLYPSVRRENRRYDYHVRKNLDFDKAEISLYECVEKMPPFSRKTLVLVGPHGLSKQPLIHKLVDANPDIYGTTLPLTSRPMGDYETDGESCWFVSQERMLEGLDNNEFLDVGEHDSYLFGTTIKSVQTIMAEHKLCILDVRPEALKLLHNSTEFLPYVIYLTSPLPDYYKYSLDNGKSGQTIELADSKARRLAEESEQIRREFQKYFDLEFVYDEDDLNSTFDNIQNAMKKLMSETQWVPRNWVYS